MAQLSFGSFKRKGKKCRPSLGKLLGAFASSKSYLQKLQKLKAPPNGVASPTSEKLQKRCLHSKWRSKSGVASRAFARPIVRLLLCSFSPAAPTTATPHLPSTSAIAANTLPSSPLPSPLLRPPLPLTSHPRWPPPRRTRTSSRQCGGG